MICSQRPFERTQQLPLVSRELVILLLLLLLDEPSNNFADSVCDSVLEMIRLLPNLQEEEEIYLYFCLFPECFCSFFIDHISFSLFSPSVSVPLQNVGYDSQKSKGTRELPYLHLKCNNRVTKNCPS